MYRIALAVLVVAASGTRADDAEAFRDEYAPHWQRLTAHLWRNVKVAGVAEVRTQLPYLDTFRGTIRFEAVADAHTLICLGHHQPSGLTPAAERVGLTKPFPPFARLLVVTDDGMAEYISRPPGVGWFRHSFTSSPWKSRGTHWGYRAIVADTQLAWPLVATDIGRGPNAFYDPLRLDGPFDRAPGRRGVQFRRPGSEAASAVVVTGGGERPAEWSYLRPDFLLAERLNNSQYTEPTAERPGAAGGYAVEYAPAPPGELPFPAVVRAWRHDPDAVAGRVPTDEVTFAEYRRHTPSPAELDMTRRFGVWPPTFDQRPLPPLPGKYWTDRPDKPGATELPSPEEGGVRTRRLLLVAVVLATFAVAIWVRRR